MTKVPVGGTWTEIFIDPVIFTEYPQSKNLGLTCSTSNAWLAHPRREFVALLVNVFMLAADQQIDGIFSFV